METLLNSKQYYDVTFSVKGRKFPVHKSILASRSPVLSALFRHTNNLDAQEIELNFDAAIAVDSFNSFLEYIYLCTIPDDRKTLEDLLVIADKVCYLIFTVVSTKFSWIFPILLVSSVFSQGCLC